MWVLIMILLVACNGDKNTDTDKNIIIGDKTVKAKGQVSDTSMKEELPSEHSEKHSNMRFRDVEVKRIGEHQFQVTGKAQVFEATISWVVEDGHEELAKGFETTDAGAPEWGNFSFTVDVTKKREESKLHIILFESSARDGSRQHELSIMLY